ncbi:barwin-like endoglucanase [Echria macrotheca]|uniref:cellulase n=1 Tax=Echria macrotheca TaxID=438768 RepID=A0AAJ0F6P4_9PEZI|nr:barwin-like endoglucanase [Echria macrotheca]
MAAILLAGQASSQQQQGGGTGITKAKSYTGWDCCKPVCATTNNRNDLLTSRGAARVCDKDNRLLDQTTGLRANSGCNGVPSSSGAAFMCDSYQPIPVADNLTYAFAIQVSDNQNSDNTNCCRCYEVLWITGAAINKTAVVQVVTPGGASGDIKKNDLIFLTPGGGVGPLSTGCTAQYGNSYSWGEQRGGFKNREACDGLPPNLQGGCYWRFNWGKGEMNGWDIQYKPTQCPSRLTDISGCKA